MAPHGVRHRAHDQDHGLDRPARSGPGGSPQGRNLSQASARASARAGRLGRPLACTLLALAALALSACAAPNVELRVAIPAPPPGEAALAAITSGLDVAVDDLRLERPAGAVGVARVTMGIPREVLQAEGVSVGDALRLALRGGLEEAGWSLPPKGEAGSGRWRLRLVLDRLWVDGYFGELTLALGLRLQLFDPSGELRARVDRSEDLVREYGGSADLAYQVGEELRLAVQGLLTRLELGRALTGERPAGAPESKPAAPKAAPKEAPQAEVKTRCAACNEPLQASWRHCPACGAARE